MSEIERLFRGMLHPCDDAKPDSEEFRTAQATAYELSDKLEDTLTEEQKALWDAFLDNRSVTQELYALEYYRQGFISGARLVVDVLGRSR